MVDDKKVLTLEKEINKLDEERQIVMNEFDLAPMGTYEKGELLNKWISLTEKRYKLKSTKKERVGLKTVKTFYKLGFAMGKWKKKKELKK